MNSIIDTAEQAEFLASFREMLKRCEALSIERSDPVLKHWVEGFHRQWCSISGEVSRPAWLVGDSGRAERQSKPALPMASRIRPALQADAVGSFWILLSELDSHADGWKDGALCNLVEGWYAQWNRVTKSDNSPAWIRRAAS